MVEDEVLRQDYLRGDGRLPTLHIEADYLAEATHKAIIACYERGARVETPKHQEGGSLGYDADMVIEVNNPILEPQINYAGIVEDGRGVMQYILEVTHGIHNHWKKSEEHPDRWGYTYNERFVDQLPFVFQRIKSDWDEKMDQWGKGIGRPSGRDYQFAIWRAGEDIPLEQDDPPCWQLGQLRLLKNKKGNVVLDYITDWRSRDLLKAWNENNLAQIELMKLFSLKISDMFGVDVKLGSYTDRSSSLHLYGLYVDRDDLDGTIDRMNEEGWLKSSCSLEDYFSLPDGDTAESLKRLIAAQMKAEEDGNGLNLSKSRLESLGYDIDNFEYPEEWDTWPSSWDVEPDASKLARVL